MTVELKELRAMRIMSLVEGTTLLLLVSIAVPLKYLAKISIGVTILGPTHGIAFVLYLWLLAQVLAGGHWTRKEKLRLISFALIPLGGFLNARTFSRRERQRAKP